MLILIELRSFQLTIYLVNSARTLRSKILKWIIQFRRKGASSSPLNMSADVPMLTMSGVVVLLFQPSISPSYVCKFVAYRPLSFTYNVFNHSLPVSLSIGESRRYMVSVGLSGAGWRKSSVIHMVDWITTCVAASASERILLVKATNTRVVVPLAHLVQPGVVVQQCAGELEVVRHPLTRVGAVPVGIVAVAVDRRSTPILRTAKPYSDR